MLVPSPTGTVPTPLPHPFSGKLTEELPDDVRIERPPAATVGSVATNDPAHTPTPPGTTFQRPPSNRGTVSDGSGSVLINGKKAARAGDPVRTCNDPTDLDVGHDRRRLDRGADRMTSAEFQGTGWALPDPPRPGRRPRLQQPATPTSSSRCCCCCGPSRASG